MLFDLEADPHEQHDIAESHPELVKEGIARLHSWVTDSLLSATHGQDPLWTVINEGGPLHVRGCGPDYIKRLRATGRTAAAERLETKHGLESCF